MFLSQKYKFQIDPAKPDVIKLSLTGGAKVFVIASLAASALMTIGSVASLVKSSKELDALDFDLEQNGAPTVV